jgi:hypothetical protein
MIGDTEPQINCKAGLHGLSEDPCPSCTMLAGLKIKEMDRLGLLCLEVTTNCGLV